MAPTCRKGSGRLLAEDWCGVGSRSLRFDALVVSSRSPLVKFAKTFL